MHVLVLHIPVGVVLLAVIADFISSRPRFAAAAQASTLLWGVAAVTGVMSVATGLMHAAEGGFGTGTIDSHRFYAILTMAGSVVVWLLRWRGGAAVAGLAKFVGLVTFVVMLVTLHYGSRVTHGERFLSAAVAGPTQSASLMANAEDLDVAAVDRSFETLAAHGWQVRPVARNAVELTVNPIAPGATLDAAAFEILAGVAEPVVELSLSRATLPDGLPGSLARLDRLAALRLDGTDIDDAALRLIAALPALRVMNLSANPRISNRSIDVIAGLQGLEQVYLWGTGVDSAGLARLGAARPDIKIQAAETFPDALLLATN